jgi:hypothetical protein
MDFSRLRKWEAIGAIGAALGALTLFLMPWYTIDPHVPGRTVGNAAYSPDNWICGTGDLHCAGFETFPTLRWVLILFGIAPIVLAYIVVRGHKLSYPPGEITMTVGITGFVLIAYNGLLDKPGTGSAEIGVTLAWGYWFALLVGILIAVAGFMRSQEGQRKVRKAPGNV